MLDTRSDRSSAYAPPPAAADEAPPAELPRGTTPTYELEMLISGTATFGLLQLPSALDQAFDALYGVATASWQTTLLIGWFLAKAMVIALIGSFLLHLATRAYWVGLVGLDSVFPNGIRWDRVSTGPVTREEHARRLPTLGRTIARLDNVASTIFSIAFLEVLGVLAIGAVIAAIGAIVWFGGLLRPGGVGRALLGWALLALLAALVVGKLTDRVVGARLRPGSALHRLLRVRARVAYYAFGVGVYGPIMYTLLTNVRKRVALPLIYLGLFGAIALAASDNSRHLGNARVEADSYLPARADMRGVAASEYESMRPAGGMPPRLPSIQSDVVEGPYVKLFVPYSEGFDPLAMRRECPGSGRLRPRGPSSGFALATGADSAAYDRAYACLARVRSVSIDGRPVADLAYRFHRNPATKLPGVIAYLPTDGLAKGMHTLVVRAAPDSAGKPRPPAEIVFWK